MAKDANTHTIHQRQVLVEDVQKERERDDPRAKNADHLCNQASQKGLAVTALNDPNGAALLHPPAPNTRGGLHYPMIGAPAAAHNQGVGLPHQVGNRAITIPTAPVHDHHTPTTGLQEDGTHIGVRHKGVSSPLQTQVLPEQHQTAKKARNLAGTIATVYAKTVPHAVNGMPTLADTC